jgi:peptide/nickel transport system ATP-binding protein
MAKPVLAVRSLRTQFATPAGIVQAVEDVSFTVERGEVMGLVGESGSGKSATGYSIMGLVDPPGRIVEGSIVFDGIELVGLEPEAMRRIRGSRLAMVFRDPAMSLNPVLRIGTQMVEAIRAHERASAGAARARALEALAAVGVPSPARQLDAYPHQLSGGMRQRVAIATALLNQPDLVVADEPTATLDASTQAQILHEVRKLAGETGTALIWITHDLSVVAELTDTVAVMYAGRIVERGACSDVLARPAHPYTQGLIDCAPSRHAHGERLRQIAGAAPSLIDMPFECAFRARCPRKAPSCAFPPELRAVGDLDRPRTARCHYPLVPFAPRRRAAA